MPLYDFNFSLDAWVKSLEIEADSLEEAKKELFEMCIEDLINKAWVKDFNIKELEVHESSQEENNQYLDYNWEG